MALYICAYCFIPKRDCDLIFLNERAGKTLSFKREEIEIIFSYEEISTSIKCYNKIYNYTNICEILKSINDSF